jgi:hypothetical protein
MSSQITPDFRDAAASAFRERLCEKLEVVPFEHQRAWWSATEGLMLLDVEDPSGVQVRLGDGSIHRRMVVPRPEGRARFVADLGAFKVGKSFGSALWAAGFGCLPDRKITLVGLEYSICEPEFSYIVDFLLSSRGMGMKKAALTNNPRQGDMYLKLENGTVYEAKSWERKDALKGKEIDAYLYCEAYQLPGIECFTSVSQNLRARRGFAVFPTTPDRPWVKELHNLGHGADSEFACICSIGAEVNPFTFDAKAKERDRSLMTREKYAIHYEGKLGDFVGRVFQYQRGDRLFSARTHPGLFDGGDSRESLRLPEGWEIVGGADTGTFYTALLVAFSPEGDAFVLDEFPNYRYVAGLSERSEDRTIPEWAVGLATRTESLGGRPWFWADQNSQFKRELTHYGLTLLGDKHGRETRTEVAREYFQHGRIYLAPWLSILPFELENAAWPEEATAAGRFERVKDRDHTLDCLEHILAQRPFGRGLAPVAQPGQWRDQFHTKGEGGNVHMGRN